MDSTGAQPGSSLHCSRHATHLKRGSGSRDSLGWGRGPAPQALGLPSAWPPTNHGSAGGKVRGPARGLRTPHKGLALGPRPSFKQLLSGLPGVINFRYLDVKCWLFLSKETLDVN